MRWLSVVGGLLLACAVIALPAIGYAQEAVITGTVTDSTGAVLPGVMIVAVHQATGNRFAAVTDERGAYPVAARAGIYHITAELAGFKAVTRDGPSCWSGRS